MKQVSFYLFLSTLLLILVLPDYASGQWDISPDKPIYEYNTGENFSVAIKLSGSDGTISALGMDFTYPDELVHYDGHDFTGTLLESWMFKDINELVTGTLRIAGFTTSGAINSGTNGTLVVLNFTVLNDISGEGDLVLASFTDDILNAMTTPAIFRVGSSLTEIWDVSPADTLYEHSPGENVVIDIRLSGTGDDINSLGFDFHFSTELLDYDSTEFSGTLLDTWQFRDANLLSAGTLRIAGFTTSGEISSPADDILVTLHFTVRPEADGEGQFTLDGFTDGLAGATTSPATFRTTTGPVEAWYVRPSELLYEQEQNTSFTVDIRLSGSGDDINSLGFDFHFPDHLLQYDDKDFTGTLLEAWQFKDVNLLSAGTLRIAGFTTSGEISSPADDILVTLHFTVKPEADGEGQFTLDGFTDGLAGATTSPATFCTTTGPVEAWYVRPSELLYEQEQNTNFTVDIRLSGSGDDINSLGFDFHFPDHLLQYDDKDFTGTLLEAWQFKDANLLSAGTLRIAGFTTSGEISSPADDILVTLHFTVKPGADGEGQFTLDGFTDGLAGATTSPATFRTTTGPVEAWDVSPENLLYQHVSGESFSINLILSGDGDEISAFGLDFVYPDDLLHYDGYDFTGTLMSAWNFKDVGTVSAGNLRIAGFTTTATIITPGKLVTLNFTVKDITAGTGQICLMNFTDDLAGATTSCAMVEITEANAIHFREPGEPASFALYNNYPNPFNPTTTIRFSIPSACHVRISIYDIKGYQICDLINCYTEAGTYDIIWDSTDSHGTELSSGIYLYQIDAGPYRAIKKMTYLK